RRVSHRQIHDERQGERNFEETKRALGLPHARLQGIEPRRQMPQVRHGPGAGKGSQNMKTAPLALLLAALAFTALACNKAPEPPKAAAYQPKLNETHTTTGVIREFASENKVVVLEHQAFPDGFMEGMTMSFQLADSKMA